MFLVTFKYLKLLLDLLKMCSKLIVEYSTKLILFFLSNNNEIHYYMGKL